MTLLTDLGPSELEARAIRALDRARRESGYRGRLRPEGRDILVELFKEGTWTVHDVVRPQPVLRELRFPPVRKVMEARQFWRLFEKGEV